jgi:hypothetical protein
MIKIYPTSVLVPVLTDMAKYHIYQNAIQTSSAMKPKNQKPKIDKQILILLNHQE